MIGSTGQQRDARLISKKNNNNRIIFKFKCKMINKNKINSLRIKRRIGRSDRSK
jgi:hypothetical protein